MVVKTKSDLLPIIILERYVDIDGGHEERIPAFLTSANHAMCVDRKTGNLLFAGVEPVNECSAVATEQKRLDAGELLKAVGGRNEAQQREIDELIADLQRPVYVATTLFAELGNVEDRTQDAEIIARLSTALHNMTAYDFIAKVTLHVEQDVDYAGLIIPNLLLEAN